MNRYGKIYSIIIFLFVISISQLVLFKKTGYCEDAIKNESGVDITRHSIMVDFMSDRSKCYPDTSVTRGVVHLLPSLHMIRCFSKLNEVKNGYATYSYVLSGDRNASGNYQKLINEIYYHTAFDAAGGLKNYNVFLIPGVCNKGVGYTNYKPDYEASLMILDIFKRCANVNKFKDAGPYIITMYEPIRSDSSEKIFDMLYLDLTGLNPAAYSDFIDGYKTSLEESKISGIGRLRSLRLDLLRFALLLEDSMGFAKIAQGYFIGSNNQK